MWDDSDNMFGEKRPCIIHYFLADGTVEVREVYKQNDGRDPFPVLMKRQRLPKTFVDGKSKFRLASLSAFACAKVLCWVDAYSVAVAEVHQVWRTFAENTPSVIRFWPKKSSLNSH